MDWHVVRGMETLSDHKYIFFRVSPSLTTLNQPADRLKYPKWSFKHFNKPLFNFLLELKSQCMDNHQSVEEMANWLTKTMQEACDLSAKRFTTRPGRRAVYWWNEEVVIARRESIAALRKWGRSRRSLGRSSCGDDDRVRNRWIEYRLARRSLRTKVKKAKVETWRQLIAGIDEDPWGLAYKIVLNRLRYSTPSLTKTLSARKLDTFINTLFPAGPVPDPIEVWWNIRVPLGKCVVSVGEVTAAIRAGRKSGSPAPGPDGITFGVWRSVSPLVLEKLAVIFSNCFRDDVFPKKWKRAKLVLIPKEGKKIAYDGDIPRARPICLLDELERFSKESWFFALRHLWK